MRYFFCKAILILGLTLLVLVGISLWVSAQIETGRATLKVQNQTQHTVYLNIQGLRVGWLRPLRSGMMRGLRAGTYRVFAHTQGGTQSWGPTVLRIPGTWTIGGVPNKNK